MHRPYLLINQPVNRLFESQPAADSDKAVRGGKGSLGTIDDPPEASMEADADAARLLSRALVVNRVGNTVDWEETLVRLGMHTPLQVDLDSTKRKRRQKMKKHKYVSVLLVSDAN